MRHVRPFARVCRRTLPLLCLTLCSPAALSAQRGSAELHLTIVHTSDEHSALLPAPLVEYRGGTIEQTRGGFARLATLIEDLRSRSAATGIPMLLTSSGDHTGGSPFSWLMREGEAPELTLMTELGYDVMTLGNHEFDHGPERLAAAIRAAGLSSSERSTIVATNTRPPAGHPLASVGLKRTHLDTLANGLRVGFIGVIGRGAARYSPAAEPVELGNPVRAATEAAAELRAAGAQIIIALSHSGMREDRALARAVPEIDIILGGHDHRLVGDPVMEGETIIIHPGASLDQLLVLPLSFAPATGAVTVRNTGDGPSFVVPLDADVTEHAAVAARVADYERQLEQRISELTGGRFASIDSTIARSHFTIGDARGDESPLGNFVADAMRTVASEATGIPVDFAFQATGNLRGDIVPGGGGGRIVLHDLVSVISLGSGPDGSPGYPIISVWLTGDEVRRVLELSILLSEVLGGSYFLQVSGLRARYDPGRAVLFRVPFAGIPIPTGRAVLSAERDSSGTPVPMERGDERLYHVVTDRYVAAFLPMVGELVPRLAVVPKDARGAPIADIDRAIVHREGQPLAAWQSVLEYAAAQPMDSTRHPRIPERYAAPAGRLSRERGVPLWIFPVLALIALVGGLVALIVRIRRRRRAARLATA